MTDAIPDPGTGRPTSGGAPLSAGVQPPDRALGQDVAPRLTPWQFLRLLARDPGDARRLLGLGWHALQPGPSPLRRIEPSPLPIDVVIPLSERHAPVLGTTVEAVRRFVLHPVGTVHVVGVAGRPELEGLATAVGCRFLSEEEVLRGVMDAGRDHGLGERAGWIRQQLVKLSAERITGARHVLVLDADTVFVRPVSFEGGGRQRLFFSGQRYEPYFRTAERLLGDFRRAPYSFIAHHMLIDAHWLREMKDLIESRAGRPWARAILENLDRSEMSSFSEYETYGSFVHHRHRDGCQLRYWRNLSRSLDDLAPLQEIVERWGGRYHTVSFHYRW